MIEQIQLDFESISRAIRRFPFPKVDLVIGIATGGIVPASLIAHQLSCPLQFMHINYRAPDNSPARPNPTLLKQINPPDPNKRILLVDDVSVSGKTISVASRLLGQERVLTFVLKGAADYVLFPDIATCVDWPWKV